jgi:hypothetical protein
MSRTNAGSHAATLHKLRADWGEGTSNASREEGRGTAASAGDATWTNRFSGGAPWQTQGGDFAPTESATLTVGGIGSYTWTSDAMAADVQSWLDDPDTSFGWLIRGNENGNQTAKRFDSKDNGTVADRPILEITFQVAAQATATSVPATATAVPTVTPVPATATALPTATPVPTATQFAAATPVPSTATAVPPPPLAPDAPQPVLISEPTAPVTGDVQVPSSILIGLSVLGALILVSGSLMLRTRRREK